MILNNLKGPRKKKFYTTKKEKLSFHVYAFQLNYFKFICFFPDYSYIVYTPTHIHTHTYIHSFTYTHT